MAGSTFSVKDKQVNKLDLLEAVKNIESFIRALRNIQDQTIRLETASLAANARSFYEDVRRLREMKDSGANEDYEQACEDFTHQHAVSAVLAQRLVVSERRIGDNQSLANAIFSHAMRNALPVHNYSDSDLVSLFHDLTESVFRGKRLRRGILDLSDLERMVSAPLTPRAIASIDRDLAGYVRTKFGYLVDEDRRNEMRNEYLIVTTFAEKLMREWRKKTAWLRFKNIAFREPIACISCGHPLNANYNGRKGLACPRCGYNPYLTFFYACDCGNGAVLMRQPDIAALALVRDVYRVLRDDKVRCMGCDEPPLPDKVLSRLFMLPIPYPIEEYTDENLVKWRVELGWKNKYEFKSPVDPKLTPKEALLRTVDESSWKVFPYKEIVEPSRVKGDGSF